MDVIDGGNEPPVAGETVLNEIFDLIAQRLPRIPLGDPVRPRLAALAPLLGRELGRPAVVALRTPGKAS